MNPGIDLQGSFIQSLIDLGLPAGAAKAIWMPLPMILMIVGATVGVLVNIWLERKISAAAQQRIGPEYIGPFGLLAPVADGLKLVFKEDVVPAKSDPLLFTQRTDHRCDARVSVLFDCAIRTKSGDYRCSNWGVPVDCII